LTDSRPIDKIDALTNIGVIMTNTIINSNTLWVVEVKGDEGFTPAMRSRSKNFIASPTRDGARALAKVLREGGAQTRVVGYTGTKSNSGK
tara:strand:+ start:460 stop:729 length:270 start_codon:yes stop_codon:yes gene_type:complete